MANEHVNKVTLGSETLIDITDTTAETSDVASGEVFYAASGARSVGTAAYASAPIANGNADKANAILYGTVDSTSTSTAFTATVAGLTRLVDGTCVMLRNGIVTSASGFTLNVNGLGDKPVYNNLATGNDITPTNPTRDTTIFNINYTMLFVYDSQLVDGGAWICYRGYDSNTNTIGYQLRTNSGNRPMSDAAYRYRLYFTSADGSKWVPANTSTSTDATTARTLNTRAIDPFGPIVYNSTNGTTNSGARPAVATLWQQYALTIGYSYVKSLTAWDSVWLKCQPNADGSAVMKDIVQALPSSNDGYIYILLGLAYSATAMELRAEHPVYWHDGTGIRLWTGAEPSSGGGSTVSVTRSLTSGTKTATLTIDDTGTDLYAPTPPTASSTTPAMDGAAAVGSSTDYARADHVHPTDTSKQDTLVSGTNIKTVNGNSLLGSGDVTVGGGATTTWYGTCSTAAATAAKVVACEGFELVQGAIIGIFFSSGNAAANPTLNVNSTGAKNIRIGTTAPNTTTNSFRWGAQTVLFFMYDGTYFSFISAQDANEYNAPHATTTWYGTSATSAGTAAKTAISTYFSLSRGSIIAITFTYGNTVNGAITLNVNSTGAKTIYVGNAATSASNPLTWDAGETLTLMYDGLYWRYLGSDADGSSGSSYELPTASASTLGGVKVGSGLSIDSSGVLSASSSGGVSMSTATATLPTSGWSSNSITVNVTGVTASNNVLVAPAPASVSAYAAAGIVCTAQGAGTLTFTRTSANTAAITVNVLILS